jgi:hypothetical protein
LNTNAVGCCRFSGGEFESLLVLLVLIRAHMPVCLHVVCGTT